MALFDSPHLSIRSGVAKTPEAIEPYVAFEETVRDQLIAWPRRSADLATGLIMSVWTRTAAKQGLIEVPPTRLHKIVTAGKLCGWQMKPAERAWAKELLRHLMQASPPAKPPALPASEYPRSSTPL